MLNRNQHGGIVTTLVIVMLVLLLGGSLVFGFWAYGGRQDYKNNVDAKVVAAVSVAKQQQTATDNAQFTQEAKNPLRAYDGPEAYGSLIVNYPKTWSAYVDDTGTGSNPVDGYFAPSTVPSVNSQGTPFALRIVVSQQAYSQVVQQFNSSEQSGQLTSAGAYALPKVPKVVGVKVAGTLPDGSNGTMVVLPLRSDTLEIWTNGTTHLDDFNNIILANLSFSP